VGALGITPLDFLLPLAMYIFLRKPVLWKKILAWILLIFYVIVMILGAVAAIRGIVLDASKHCCQSCCMRFSISYDHCWRMSRHKHGLHGCHKHGVHDVISTLHQMHAPLALSSCCHDFELQLQHASICDQSTFIFCL